MIEVVDVTKRYGQHCLDRVSFKVDKGEFSFSVPMERASTTMNIVTFL